MLVVGDVMVDIIVRPEGPLASGADRRASIRPCPGGSGANQAAWLAACGVKARFAGRVGCADHALQGRLLEAAGVEPLLGADETLPTGALVALIALDGERSFLTDRGANARLCRADLPITLLDGVDLLHVSGYALFSPGPRAAVRELMDAAGRRGIPVTVDPASHSCLEEVGPENFLKWTRQAHICFPNEAEAAMLAGTEDPEEQLRALSRRYESVVIKRGAAGAVAAMQGAQRWSAAALPADAIDTSGAGDAFVAGFLAAFVHGLEVAACLWRGLETASQAVGRIGARPVSNGGSELLSGRLAAPSGPA